MNRHRCLDWFIKYLLLFLPLMTTEVFARGTLTVADVRGNVFASSDGNTWILEKNESFGDLTEVLTEEGAEISIVDVDGRRYHLSGSTHLKFMNKLLELRRGRLWVQQQEKRPENKFLNIEIHTANSKIVCDNSDAILSFDHPPAVSAVAEIGNDGALVQKEFASLANEANGGKTQLLVINGGCSIGNFLLDQYQIMVNAGQFSFVSGDYQSGIPRKPTSIGQTSYHAILSSFNISNLSLLQKGQIKKQEHGNWNGRREIASEATAPAITSANLHARAERGTTPGKIIKVPYQPREWARNFNLEYFNQKSLAEIPKPKVRKVDIFAKKSSVPIKIYGQRAVAMHTRRTGHKEGESGGGRSPASLNENELNAKKQYLQKRREDNKVDRLLKDLNNIRD